MHRSRLDACANMHLALNSTESRIQKLLPTSAQEWKRVADEFNVKWDFPICLGALDGKHIDFEAPKSAGSFYYNYKGRNSIVLLGLTDANYKFLYVDVGVNGRVSDGGVFRESSLKKGIDRKILNFPEDSLLPNSTIKVPYVIVCDDAFPLTNRLMKPYPQRGLSTEKRIFNYRLSRARRTVENAFGILVNRFRILQTTINLNPSKVETITLACCVLHNFLSMHSAHYTEMDNEECNLESLSQQAGSRYTSEAINIRNQLCNYFNTIGKVSWQNRAIGIE
ncbi:unnamed protein product [Callosobruchus maculatus]|uniref:DDE Tnp4 domain-containing protein n=1 Tax=Callosobruchus maculatus TaxID=64391 RepID=A0A653DIK6_CALMS|nr:unnamed protein product [Callosobruchus maculatus]